MEVAEARTKRLIAPWALLNEWQQAALIDFVCNLDAGVLAGSTLRRKLMPVTSTAAAASWVRAASRVN